LSDKNEVQFIVSVVDKATAEMQALNQNLSAVGAAANRANEQASSGFEKAAEGAISLNQALELVEKGFHLLEQAIELPIRQFEKLLDVSIDLVKEYDQQYLGQVKLRSILKATGQGGEEQAESLQKLAESLELVTRFQADAIVEGQHFALASGANVKIIPQMTEAALDLATAFGKDAAEGFRALTRAMNTGAVTIDRNKVFTLQATDAYGRLQEAIRLTQERFPGLAREVATGGAGPIIKLENAINQLKQGLGALIAQSPPFQAFVKTANQFVTDLTKFFASHPEQGSKVFGLAFAASFQLAASAVEIFISILGAAGDAVVGLINLLDAALPEGKSPIGRLRNEIEATKDSIKGLRALQDAVRTGENLGDFSRGMNPSAPSQKSLPSDETLSAEIEKATNKLDMLIIKQKQFETGDFFGGTIDNTKRLADELKKLIAEAQASSTTLADPIGAYNNALEEAVNKTSDFAVAQEKQGAQIESGVNAWKDLNDTFRSIRGPAKDADIAILQLGVDIEEFAGTGEAGITFLTKQLERLKEKGKLTQDQFDALTVSIRNAFSSSVNFAPGGGGGGGGSSLPGGGGGGGGGSSGGGAPAGGGQSLIQIIDQAIQKLSAAIVGAASGLTGASNDLAQSSNLLGDAGAATGIAAIAMTEAAGVSFSAAEKLDSTADAQAKGANMLQSASFSLSSVTDNLLKVARHLYEAANKLLGAPGGAPFAQGGIVTRPLIGSFEGKVPEAVVPLDDRGAAFMRRALGNKLGGLGGGVTINIDVGSLELSDRGADKIVAEVSRKLYDKVLETSRRAR